MSDIKKHVKEEVKRIREYNFFTKGITINLGSYNYTVKLEENNLYWDIYLEDQLYAKIPDVGSVGHVVKMIFTIIDY